MIGVAQYIKTLSVNSMKKQPVMLCVYNFEFVEVYAKGGIW